MKSIISDDGHILLPAELRTKDHLVPGQIFEIDRISPGVYLLKAQPLASNAGLVDWLLACPEKGWFAPISADQFTDG